MWWTGRLCAFDIETTGTDVETDRIVTATVALVGAGQPLRSFSVLIDPGVEIPEEATAIHGISTERAREHGLAPAVGVGAVLRSLRSSVAAGYPVVAFRAPFDLTIAEREAHRYGLEFPDERLRVIDPSVIDKFLHRYRKGSRKLAATCEHYGATLDKAHESQSDAVAAARLAWVMGKRGEVIRRARDETEARERAQCRREWEQARGNLDRLHEAQKRWAAEQAHGLADHFRREGQPQIVPTAWPLIPRLALAHAMR